MIIYERSTFIIRKDHVRPQRPWKSCIKQNLRRACRHDNLAPGNDTTDAFQIRVSHGGILARDPNRHGLTIASLARRREGWKLDLFCLGVLPLPRTPPRACDPLLTFVAIAQSRSPLRQSIPEASNTGLETRHVISSVFVNLPHSRPFLHSVCGRKMCFGPILPLLNRFLTRCLLSFPPLRRCTSRFEILTACVVAYVAASWT